MAHKTKSNKLALLLTSLGITAFCLVLAFIVSGKDVALLNPKGMVANEQHWLMIVSTLIMLAFGVPVVLTLYFFVWRYREGARDSAYDPAPNTNKALLLFAWGGPFVIVAVLASLMLPATQRLVPQKPLESDKPQLTIQVVSLNWKWLFIYPKENIAAVNFTQFPVDTPVRFELTADEAPMSSFWIPHLGGMLYTMTGHVNPLNLIADTTGDYPGKTAEINGKGFAGMKFTARVSSQEDFDAWVAKTKRSSVALSEAEYQKLLQPSENNEPAYYRDPSPGLIDSIVSKYSEGHMHDSQDNGHGSY